MQSGLLMLPVEIRILTYEEVEEEIIGRGTNI